MEFVPIKVENCDSIREDETCDTKDNIESDSAYNRTRSPAFVEVKMEIEDECTKNNLPDRVPVKEELVEDDSQVDLNADEDECLSVFNLREDIEISVDEMKQEIQVPIDSCADFQQNSGVLSISTAVNLDLSPDVPLCVKAPARTYRRPIPNRKRSLFWDAEENTGYSNKSRKIDHLFDKKAEINTEELIKNEVLAVGIQEEICKSESTSNENTKKKNSKNSVNRICNPVNDVDNCNSQQVDRRHSCFICKQRHVNMHHHLLKKHSTHTRISCITKLPKNSDLRKEQLLRLRRIGDMQHNVGVLRDGSGPLIVLRQSEKFIGKVVDSEFLPCTYCVGFVHRSQLRRHHLKCVFNSRLEGLKENLLSASKASLMWTVSQHHLDVKQLDLNDLTKERVMLENTIAEVARNDLLIIMLGKYLLVKENGEMSSTARKELAKNAVHKMACLLLTCRKLPGNRRINLSDCLAVKRLDSLISVVLRLLMYRTNVLEKYELYTLYYRQLVNCIFGLRGKYLAKGNLIYADKLLEFFCQFNKEWQKEVSSIFSPLNLSKNSKPQKKLDLPQVDNVTKLKECLTESIESLTVSLKEQNATTKDAIRHLWFALAEKTMCLLSLFNAVDFQLIESLTILDYAVKPDWRVDKIKDYELKMSRVPYHMAENRFIVKTGDKETILLFTGVVKQAIDMLIAWRTTVGVSPGNPYVFAEPYHSDQSLKAGICFFKTCVEPGELNVDVMKKKNRQYLTYMTLITDMTPEELEWLKMFYCLIEKMKYLKNLYNPLIKAWRMYGFDAELKKASCTNNTKEKEPKCLKSEPDPPSLTEPTATAVFAPEEPKCDKPNEFVQPTIVKISFCKGVPEGYSQNAPKLAALKIVNKRRMETIKTVGEWRVNKMWSPEELDYVRSYFQQHILNEKIPGMLECLKCLEKRKSLLKNRSWTSIKSCVVAEIENRLKIQEADNPLFLD